MAAVSNHIDGMVRVEALVYSGRQNPNWRLSGQQAREFEARLVTLPAFHSKQPPSLDGLGYQGVAADVETRDGTHRRFLIVHGTAISEAEGRAMQDAGRSLELWLLKTGRDTLDSELLDYLVAQAKGGN